MLPRVLVRQLRRWFLTSSDADAPCAACQGTGMSEEAAELGESFSRGMENILMEECRRCAGTGQSAKKASLTPLGWASLLTVIVWITVVILRT